VAALEQAAAEAARVAEGAAQAAWQDDDDLAFLLVLAESV
jgi:hypothetical protein